MILWSAIPHSSFPVFSFFFFPPFFSEKIPHAGLTYKEYIRGARLGKIRLRKPCKIKKGFSVFEL